MSLWDSPELEEQRAHKRNRLDRIAKDCFNLMLDGTRAYCSKGHFQGRSRDRTMDIGAVLRGKTPKV